MTVGALQEPIEFVETAPNAVVGNARRTSFAYIGPVEWDKSGDLSYQLWLHVAPGNDRLAGDIRAPGAVTLLLDDGPVALSAMEPAVTGSGPYRPVASWGQTQYFRLDVPLLARMAHSQKLVLVLRGTGRDDIQFLPTHDTSPTLKRFIRSRGITDD